jgi:hypothetical protein
MINQPNSNIHMATLPVKLQKIVDEGYSIDLGAYISKGFNIFGKNIGGFIGYFLLLGVIYFASVFIPFIGPLAFLVCMPALVIGFAYVANRLDNNREVAFGDFFKGFDKFGELFIGGLLIALISVAALLPGYALLAVGMFSEMGDLMMMESDASPDEVFGIISGMMSSPVFLLGLLLTIIPGVYVSVVFSWTYYLIWFYNMRAWDAMMASRALIGKQFWMFLLFMIVTGLIGGLGIIVLAVGMLVTYPAMLCAQYAAFADITRLDEEEGEQDVLDHFAPVQGA